MDNETPKCSTCKNRAFYSWGGHDYCINYEMASTEGDLIEAAKNCPRYERGTPACLENKTSHPSATAGNYGPGNPWDAPGMSLRDFI